MTHAEDGAAFGMTHAGDGAAFGMTHAEDGAAFGMTHAEDGAAFGMTTAEVRAGVVGRTDNSHGIISCPGRVIPRRNNEESAFDTEVT